MAQIYKHFKGGIYELLHIGTDSEDVNRKLVIYRSLENGNIWVRPLDEFFSDVTRSGITMKRFTLIGNTDNDGIVNINGYFLNYNYIWSIEKPHDYNYNLESQRYFSIHLINGSLITIFQTIEEKDKNTTKTFTIDLLYKAILNKDFDNIHLYGKSEDIHIRLTKR